MSGGISQARIEFASAFASLAAPTDPDAQNHIATMLLTCNDIPDAVFSDPRELAIRLAPQFDRFPNAARLKKALLEEAKAHQAKALPLPYATEQGLDETDRHWIAGWMKRAPGGSEADRATLLHTLRQYAPRAFDVLCRDNVEDADWLAQSKDWEPEWRRQQRHASEWTDVEKVRLSVMKLRLEPEGLVRMGLRRMMMAALTKYAPHNLTVLDQMDPLPVSPPPPPARPAPVAPPAAVRPSRPATTIEGVAEPANDAAAALVSASGMDW